jgi:glycosyltransferase involved in cell wall biosynthesis
MNSAEEFLKQLGANAAPGVYYETDEEASREPGEAPVRLIAFYLPQFHPIPENDIWWGKGFTEWTNVTKAIPRFLGHYQPQLPGELGFYDLRIPATIRRQAALAKKYGIGGFCFHHYWFGGKQVLETPLKLFLSQSDIDLPFCICWANENWTRRWDGLEHEVLIAQNHSPEDDIAFARALEAPLCDPRYIRVNDRPLIIVYRPSLLPDAVATARRWRTHFARAGLGDPYLVMAQTFGDEDPRLYAFDAALEFPPHNKFGWIAPINDRIEPFEADYQGVVRDYEEMIRSAAAATAPEYTRFRCVCPGWDNEARTPGRGHVFAYSTPEKYGRWLGLACKDALKAPNPSERLVFINAWNEWAEGAHLEPDRHFGYAYLRETSRVIASLNYLEAPVVANPRLVVVSHDAYPFGAQKVILHLVRTLVQEFGMQVQVLLGGPGDLEEAFREAAPTERVKGGFADTAAWGAVARRLRADGFTVALCNTVVSAQAIRPLRAGGLRIICLVHELPSLIQDYGLLHAAQQAAREADVVVFASACVRDRFTEVAGPIVHKCMVRPQGLYKPAVPPVDHAKHRAEARKRLGACAADQIVLGAGKGDLRKGIDLWPLLIRQVMSERPDVLFVWSGSVDSNLITWLQHDLEVAGHARRFRLSGPEEDVRFLYPAADVFVLTSREDPFPSVVLEAMAHGLPVIAFEGSGGIVDLVRQTGSPVAPYLNIEAMAGSIVQLLGDEATRRSIGEAGRRKIERDFDFVDYARDMLRLAQGHRLTVSVVVPNYNYGRYLRQRLESVWSQTYPVDEIILLDDASSDDSASVIEELERTTKNRFRVVRNAVNSGSVSRQWLKGVELARGDVVWLAEADDFADASFLAATIKAFDNPEVVVSYCQSRQIDETGVVLAESYLDYVSDVDPLLWQANYCRPGRVEIEDALSVKNTIPNVSAVLFRREVLAHVLRKHAEEMATFPNVADWLCYIRVLSEGGSISFIATSLNNHRRHKTSVTLGSSNLRHLEEISAINQLVAEMVPVRPDRLEAAKRWREVVAAHFGIAMQGVAYSMPIVPRAAWLETICSAYEGRRNSLPFTILPGFPSDELQITTTGSAGRVSLREAYTFYLDCVSTFERFGRPITRTDRLLDFGVGWGRIGRFFLNEIEPDNLYGIDVDAQFIEICRRTFPVGHFLTCDPWPPTSLPDEHFSFIVGYSVFSHLSEEACRAWMKEFHRLLVPGGLIALTTNGRSFFDTCASWHERAEENVHVPPPLREYRAALARLYPDVELAKSRYDAGELVFATSAGVSGGGPRNESYYGETCIPERFAAHAFLPDMELLEFQFDSSRHAQPIMFFRRPI